MSTYPFITRLDDSHSCVTYLIEFVLAHLISNFDFALPPSADVHTAPKEKKRTKIHWQLGGIVVPGVEDSHGGTGSGPACPFLVSLAPSDSIDAEGDSSEADSEWVEGESEWEEMEC